MNAIILAGGRASRMEGEDKAFLKIKNELLIQRQLKLLKKVFKRIIIVTNSSEKYKNFKGVKIISDIIPHSGPLGGIFSGLLYSRDKYNFVVACDMPCINLNLIRYLQRQASGYDLIVPRVDNKYEPLFSVYSKNCLPDIKNLLEKKIFKISKLFSKVKVKAITKEEIIKFGSPDRIFMNINTPNDLSKIQNA